MIHESMDILSNEVMKKIYPTLKTDQLLSEKIITPSPLHPKKYFPTVTGVLMFSESPEKYIQEAVIHCTRFRGTEGRNIIQTEEIKGPLEQQLEISIELLKAWLTRDYKLKGAKLVGKTIIPEVAFREAIINALIHRKYWLPGAVKIAVFDDRLEIFSPGNFPGALDLHSLGDGTTYLRNPLLARVARRFGLVEKLGTGIKLIIESCLNEKIKKPEFIEGADSVKVIFSFSPAEDKYQSDEDKIMAMFEIYPELKIEEIVRHLNISKATIVRKLNNLIKEKKIVRQGKGPAVSYRLIQSIAKI